MLKKLLKIGLGIFVGLLVVGAGVIFLVTGAMRNAAKLTEYEFGADKVPSVNAVVGETRNVTGLSTGISSNVEYKEYAYETASMFDDMTAYVDSLLADGWAVQDSFDFNNGSGIASLYRASADEGKVLLMKITFDNASYSIRIEKGEGAITEASPVALADAAAK